MQLGGGTGIVVALLAAVPAAAQGGHGSQVVFFFALLYGVRAAFQRAAGNVVLYATDTSPRRAIATYVWVAACHSAVMVLLLREHLDATTLARVAMLLMAWPAVLLVYVSLPRVRAQQPARALMPSRPVSADRDLAGAAVLMAVLGGVGAAGAAVFMAVLTLGDGTRDVAAPQGMAMLHGLTCTGPLGPGAWSLDSVALARWAGIAAAALLLARSVIHIRAGLGALRGHDADTRMAPGVRYCAVARASARAAAVILGIAVLAATGDIAAAALTTAGAGMALRSWPTILLRLYSERRFEAYLAEESGGAGGCGPDSGLQALGWVLLGLGAIALGQWLAGLPAAAAHGPLEPWAAMDAVPWRVAALAGLALWAGAALVGARPRGPRWASWCALMGLADAAAWAVDALGGHLPSMAGGLLWALELAVALVTLMLVARTRSRLPVARVGPGRRPA